MGQGAPRLRLAVCKGNDCRMRGGDEVFKKAKALVELRGLSANCEVVRGGCYGLCGLGPHVVVRNASAAEKQDLLSGADFKLLGSSDETCYGPVDSADVPRLIHEHVEGGRPVDELRLKR